MLGFTGFRVYRDYIGCIGLWVYRVLGFIGF